MINPSGIWRPKKKDPIQRILGPFQHFIHAEMSSGILLLVCTAVALFFANSPWSHEYEHIWERHWDLSLGRLINLSKPVHFWINDGLMAVFFFVVGLEIKREFKVGELSRPREAALPIVAALGGMIFPAAIYVAINYPFAADPERLATRGWGIPMATDIAFSLGIVALLGRRVPVAAKVFITAFAIVDDLGASLVIAVFYTDAISLPALGAGLIIFMAMWGMNVLGTRRPLPYAILGVALWGAFLKSGVHPTIAGVLAAITIPARTRLDSKDFLECGKAYLSEFEKRGMAGINVLTNAHQHKILFALENRCEQAQTPLQRLEHTLHPWVAFFIMPIFALSNAGVHLGNGPNEIFRHLYQSLCTPVTLGVIFGLILGKQIGITLFSWLAVRLGLARLPAYVTWRHIYGLSWLGSIGFTMAIFIASLAFKGDNETAKQLLTDAKIGILAASVIAGVCGYLILRTAKPIPPSQPEMELVTPGQLGAADSVRNDL